MMFKNNTSALRYSKVRSPNSMLPKKKRVPSLFRSETFSKNNKTRPPMKPTYVKKRSVSLPSELSPTTVKTRTLFWFIPTTATTDHRQRRRSRCRDESFPERIPAPSAMDITEHLVTKSPLVLSPEISEQAALEWIATPSVHSLSDTTVESRFDDDNDDSDEESLFGLEFIDSVHETTIER